jgi:hypothetical protein
VAIHPTMAEELVLDEVAGPKIGVGSADGQYRRRTVVPDSPTRSPLWLVVSHVAAPDFRTSVTAADRQSLDDAWWTGPIVAAGAATLPQGHALIEPYVYDVVTRGRYDSDGNYRSTDTVHSYGSLTYMLYGVTDSFTAGVIRRSASTTSRAVRTAPASASAM